MCGYVAFYVLYFVSFVTFVSTITTDEIWDDDDSLRHEFGAEHLTLNRTRRQSGDGRCILPPYPNHGTYVVTNQPNAAPGQSVEHFVMTVICRRGYGFVETGSDTKKLHCSSGDWSQKMPNCVRFCKLNVDPSISYICHVPGHRLKPCTTHVAPGTTVTATCSAQYYAADDVKYMTCKHFGVWSAIAKCKADCGRVTPQAELLLIGGTFATFGELPWHAAVYDKTYQPYEQICGGSIVSNNVVISAAHCFWSDASKQLPPYNYAVATGKLYRPWHEQKDAMSVQKSDIEQIKIPSLFQGAAANFQQDIAVLILTTPFTYKAYVRPVCYDFNAEFDKWQLKKDNLGKVAGWGLTGANGGASTELKVVKMPFVDEDTCIKTVPPSFREYITGDKFCAGYVNGTAVCKGDSGGGLVFADVERTIERYYLRGVVSASPRNDEKLCNDLTYTAFTKITEHEKFITETIAANTPKTCSWYLFQCDDGSCVDLGAECNGINDCADGSDESYLLCTPGATTTTEAPPEDCILPPYPRHGLYEVGNDPDALPGHTSESFALIVTCHGSYGIQSEGLIDGSQTLEVFCFNGEWLPSIPQCVRFCKLYRSPRISYKCIDPKTTMLVTCKDFVIEGTLVIPTCLAKYQSYGALNNMTCVEGKWDFIAECYAECGHVIPESEQRVLLKDRPFAARLGEAPWYVAVYKTTYPSPERDGTLISNRVVLTSAHGLNPNENEYVVAVGKFFDFWDDKRDTDYAQRASVKEILQPELRNSIALLLLTSSFNFNDFVKPVCLNFNNDYESLQGEVGKMALLNFDLDPKTNSPDNGHIIVLNKLFDRNPDVCAEMAQNITQPILFPEYKMCVMYTVTGLVISNKWGSGLVFAQHEANGMRYFLRGVHTAVNHVGRGQNVYVFTKLERFREFIYNFI